MKVKTTIDETIISEITMIRAHANELATKADSLLKKLRPAKKRGGLTDQQTAKLIAQKNKRRI